LPTPRFSHPDQSRIFRTVAAVAALLIAAAGWIASRPQPAAPFDRVVLLGFDGATPAVVELLAAQGRLPALKRLMEQGAYGRLRTFHPNKSAILWTSIATGKTMVKHGIVDWTYLDEKGIAVPYKDRARRTRAYWEILSEHGISAGTINWWVTYPPRPIANGWVVSNAFRHRHDPATVYPPSLFPEIAPLVVDQAAAEQEMPKLGLTRWREEDATFPLAGTRNVVASYPLYVSHDLTVDRVSDRLWETHPVKVFSTYFRLPDVTGHLASNYVARAPAEEAAEREKSGTLDQATVARMDAEFARVVGPAYEWMDRTVAKWLQRIDGRTLLIVCSDHGFRYVNGGYYHAPRSGEPPDGVLFLYGQGVKRTRINGASLFDVAPTILYAMGLARGRDMDGGALSVAFDDAVQKRHPAAVVASYERDGAARAGTGPGTEVDDKVMEDLRALGYVQGAGPPPTAAPDGER
jgi:predicted AlkP superfamily phosphohydrolase/phosphomutase